MVLLRVETKVPKVVRTVVKTAEMMDAYMVALKAVKRVARTAVLTANERAVLKAA